MVTYKEGDVVEVVWTDPSVRGGWQSPEDARAHKPTECTAVGHMVKSNDSKFITLALLSDEDGGYGYVFSIPAEHITKLRRLRKKNE